MVLGRVSKDTEAGMFSKSIGSGAGNEAISDPPVRFSSIEGCMINIARTEGEPSVFQLVHLSFWENYEKEPIVEVNR